MDAQNFRLDPDITCSDSKENIFRVILLEEGGAQVKIDFTTFSFQNPALIFVSENQLLNIQSQTNNLKGVMLCFSSNFFCIKLNRSETFCDAVIFNTTKPPYILLDQAEVQKINYLIMAMYNELHEADEFQEEIITSQLKTLLLHASKIKLKQFGEVNLSSLSPIVTSFQDLLDQEYEREHQVQFYASRLNISQKGLNKVVKKELGRTVGELIKEKLVIEAKRALYAKNLSVKEIAFKLGFSDPAYFSRFFKKETTQSPKEYAELL